jgi:hypothetical protein
MNAITDTNFLKWFSGKALVKAEETLAILNKSLAVGYWVDRGGVKSAALFKANVALKRANKEGLARKTVFGYDCLHLNRDIAGCPAWVAEMVVDFAPVTAAIAHLEEVSEENKALVDGQASGNPMGICACCFRAQKVRPNGLMFNHGFTRPGWGYIVGGCPGAEFKPYSVRVLS